MRISGIIKVSGFGIGVSLGRHTSLNENTVYCGMFFFVLPYSKMISFHFHRFLQICLNG